MRTLMLCFALGAASATGACGGGDRDLVVARVGAAAVSKAEVDHWTRVIARGFTPANGLGAPRGASARQAALGFLISAKWLAGEAAADGAPVSGRAVARRIGEQMGAEGGEFTRGSQATGRTIADVRIEMRAELAAEAIRGLLIKRASKVTPAEVLASYRRNSPRLRLGQLRGIQVIYGLPTRAAALAFRERVGTGPGFARRALHEFVELIPTQDTGKRALLHAIFSARPNRVSRPIAFGGGWALFIVKRVVPPRLLPFAQVRADANALLVAARHQAITSAFVKAYRQRWVARTSCLDGYIVQQCSSYTGARRTEADPFWDPLADRLVLAPRPVRVPAPRG